MNTESSTLITKEETADAVEDIVNLLRYLKLGPKSLKCAKNFVIDKHVYFVHMNIQIKKRSNRNVE